MSMHQSAGTAADGGQRLLGRLRLLLALAVLLLCEAVPAAEEPSVIERLLDILGVSTDVDMLRSGGSEISGNIYLLELDAKGMPASSSPTPLTATGGWQWPIFHQDGHTLLALHDKQLVQLDAYNGRQVNHWLAPAGQRFVKLLGALRSEPGTIGVLLEGEDRDAFPALFSLGKGTVSRLDIPARERRKWMALLQNPVRGYGEVRVETRGVPSRVRIMIDERVAELPGCADADCAQGALAPGGRAVVYIVATE